MHPLILQQLVTDRVNDIIATVTGSRWAREARRTRRARTSGRGRRRSQVRRVSRLSGRFCCGDRVAG
jgi:hypothetical protein